MIEFLNIFSGLSGGSGGTLDIYKALYIMALNIFGKFLGMGTPNLYVAVILIFIGIFVISYSYRIGIGSINHPGSGLFPFLIGSALFLLSLYKFNMEIKRKTKMKQEVEQSPIIFKKIIALTSSLLFYAFFLQLLGYLITTFITISFILRIAGYKSWFRILLYTVIIVFTSYFLFTTLGVRFPKGIIG